MDEHGSLMHYKKVMRLSPETTNEELREMYASWSHTFDEDTVKDLGWIGHVIASEKLSKKLEELRYGLDVSILDLGCGTGLVGQELHKLGYTLIDGMDLCPEILETAKAKGVYRKLTQGAMGSDECKDLGISPSQYDAAICTGVFTVGHVKGKGFDDLLYVLKQGGLACFTIRDCIANNGEYGYETKMNELSCQGKWKLLVKSYEKYHKDDPNGWQYIYQKL